LQQDADPMLTSPVSDSDELDQETAGRDRSDADQAEGCAYGSSGDPRARRWGGRQ